MCYTKDIAKILVGAAFVEIINHTILAVSNLLPLHFFGMPITATFNLFVLLGWTILFAAAVYYAWVKKEASMFDRLKHPFTK